MPHSRSGPCCQFPRILWGHSTSLSDAQGVLWYKIGIELIDWGKGRVPYCRSGYVDSR